MKLTSKQIIQRMDEDECKIRNVQRLSRALNKHMGVSVNYDTVRQYVTEGAEGAIAAHIAHELGLDTPEGYIAAYKVVEEGKPKLKLVPVYDTDKKSQYKGVYWHKTRGKWAGRLFFKGKNYCFGYDADEVVIAKAYNDKFMELLPQMLNQIDEVNV